MRTPSALSLALLAGAWSVLGCTPSQIKLVDGGTGLLCQGVVVASGDPGAIPLCVTGEEVAQAIADLAEQARQAEPRAAKVAALAPASNKALYKQIVANRAKKTSAK